MLIGCADDLVVSHTGGKHAGGGVRGNRLVCALAAPLAQSARLARWRVDSSGTPAPDGQCRTPI